MDFFERQHRAKKNTGYLVFLFFLAITFVTFLNQLIVGSILAFSHGPKGEPDFSTLYDPIIIFWVFLGTMGIIGLASVFRSFQLKEGGSAIATMMGGQLVNMATTHPDERKLMNVVEEMAIASSVPIPEVFVMHGEEAINAFAAGFTPNDAVIGVTAGCIRQLSRDELQGVIAHEFSHILNQDMRLNLKLVAVVFGLIVLTIIGRVMMEIGFGSSRYRRRDGEGGGALAIGIAGLGILAAGGLGVFMGNLIKSAVSRQREYLADSSAVQFTRNPEGLSGALKKIGALSLGSRLGSPRADEASHMFFGNGLRESWFNLTSTHPPLLERIQLIEPSFHGDFTEVKLTGLETEFDSSPETEGTQAQQAGIPIPGVGDALGRTGIPVMGLAAASDASVRVQSVKSVADSIGNPTPEHVDFAVALLRSLPETVRAAAHDTHDACALMFALLLDDMNDAIKDRQLEHVEEFFGEHMVSATARLQGPVMELDPRAKLPVADLAVGALKQLSPDQYESFIHVMDALAAADEQLDLFEFSLSKLVVRHLEPRFTDVPKKVAQVYSLKRVGSECSMLISSLACAAGEDEETIREAYEAGAAQLTSATEIRQVPAKECGLDQLDGALDKLSDVAPNLKRHLIEAAAATVSADGFLQIEEAELLRAISDSLDCPMPPLAIALDAAA